MVVADSSGKPVRQAALDNDDDEKTSQEGQALVAQAAPRAAAEAWSRELPEIAPDWLNQVFTGAGGVKPSFKEDFVGRDCALFATWSEGPRTVSGLLFLDRRPAHPGATMALTPCVDSKVAAVVSPDAHRAAVAWNLIDEDDGNRAHLAYVSIQDLATVQILDAGAGKNRVDEITAGATSAGFHFGPSAKAKALKQFPRGCKVVSVRQPAKLVTSWRNGRGALAGSW